LRLYRQGRDRLLEAGYRQVSMRMFRGPRVRAGGGPVYRCQEDGMVGLACGARSYTRGLHYSSEFAVSPGAVQELIEAYAARTEESFARADHGIVIDEEDQRRRYVILSLLLAEGLDLHAYRRRFGTEVFEDLPELDALEAAGLARQGAGRLVLTEAGLERSDVIGPWLHSDRVQGLMDRYRLR
jgi:oxygen-independent coproporphyrinogen-3 oxidase